MKLSPMLRWIDKASAGFAHGSAAVVALMLLHIVADVSSRVLLNQPLAGTLEYVQWIWMPAMVFLALGLAQTQNEHISATVLVDLLRPRVRRAVDIFALSCAVIATAILIYPAYLLAERAVKINDIALSAAFVPRWPVKVLVVACLVLLLLTFVASLARRIAGAPGPSLEATQDGRGIEESS